MSAAELVKQFKIAKARGWLTAFLHADNYDVPPYILMAIASRETNMKNIIGDNRHGYGLMQIDKRYFPEWCRSGKWKIAVEGIHMGAFVLRSKYNEVISHKVPEKDAMKVAVAAYNAGVHAINDYLIHKDPDLRTTGHDYSRDVLARSKVFKRLIDQSI